MKTKQISDRRSPIHLTPLAIEVLLHYHCCCAPFERPDTPAVIEVMAQFQRDGILTPSDESDSGYETTDLGKLWVRNICHTQAPSERDLVLEEVGSAIERLNGLKNAHIEVDRERKQLTKRINKMKKMIGL